MGASVRLGKILGIPVSLHFSWFIIFFLFTIIFEGHFDKRSLSWSAEERWIAAVATSVLLFLSVLAHELSHSLVAIRRGIPVKGITLFIFGGVSQIAREAQKPSTEFMVAVVGPLASVILGLLFLGLAMGLEGVSQHLSSVAWVLVSVNIALAVFNMLPGFPMDGGRVLRAVVWQITRNYWRATSLATRGGQVVALAMTASGIVLLLLASDYLVLGLQLVVIGIFLLAIASASHRQYRLRERLGSYTAREVMTIGVGEDAPVDVVSVNAVSPEEVAYDVMELMDERGLKQVLVVEQGVTLGYIDRDSILRMSKTSANSRGEARA